MPSPNPNLTVNYHLPSPKPSDPPDIPGDIKALADAVDAALLIPPTFPQIMLSKKVATPVTALQWFPLEFPDLDTPSGNTHPSFFGQKHGGVEIKKTGLYLSETQIKIANSGGHLASQAVCNLEAANDNGVTAEVLSQQTPISPQTLAMCTAHMSSVNLLAAGYVVRCRVWSYQTGVTHAQDGGDFPSYLRVTYLGPWPAGLPDPTPLLTVGQQASATP
jgi:hypothetical protein